MALPSPGRRPPRVRLAALGGASRCSSGSARHSPPPYANPRSSSGNRPGPSTAAGIRIASRVIRLRLGHAIFLIGRRRQNLRRASCPRLAPKTTACETAIGTAGRTLSARYPGSGEVAVAGDQERDHEVEPDPRPGLPPVRPAAICVLSLIADSTQPTTAATGTHGRTVVPWANSRALHRA